MKTCWPMLLISIFLGTAAAAQSAATDTEQEMWCTFEGPSGPGKGKQIVLIAGDDEYRSEEAFPMLARILARHHGFKCAVLFPINEQGVIQPDFQTKIPGMHLLSDADLVILGLRFRNLPDEDMQHFDTYLESGKPVLAIRTTTHAFRIPADRKYNRYSYDSTVDGWEGGFGRRVLGDTWVTHHGDHGQQSTRGVINPEYRSHPILHGVGDIWGPTDVYAIKHLPANASVLVHGQVVDGMKPDDPPLSGRKNDPMMPLAWITHYGTANGKTAKIFCTTMGAATDFQSPGLRRMIVNAVYWGTELEDAIRPDLNVSLVGDYQPTEFGFGNYRRNLKPGDYQLKY